jgi:serine/threonine protein kinase
VKEQETTIETPTSENSQTAIVSWTCPTCKLSIPITASICPQDGTPHDAKEQLQNLLSSNYEFISTVGTGGMSVIYKARQLLLNKTVAIKMLHSHLLNEHSTMRFQQEAKAASSLNHPNVISVHDFGISQLGQPYMVMDFIDGNTLAEIIKSRGALPLPEAMDIFIAVAAALEHAHQNNVLHRDLKPSNIMLREKQDGYDVFLVDFGIAKIIDTENGGVAQQLTQTGDVMGSPLYMSPEQCMGKKLDQRSDIYSYGCILYEAVAGVPPHRGNTMLETIFKHLNETAAPLHVVRPDITFPEAFEDLVESLLATHAEDRVQTIAEVKQRLEDIQAGALNRTLPAKAATHIRFKLDKPIVISTVGAILAIVGLVSLSISENKLQHAQKLVDDADRKVAKGVHNSQQTNSLATISSSNLEELAKKDPTYENLRKLPRDTQSFDLSHTRVTDGALLALTNLPNLRSLDLSNTKISDLAVEAISKLPSLTKLCLHTTTLSSKALAKLAAIPDLETLDLSNTNTDDNTLKSISKLKNISELNISDTKISNRGLSYLQNSKTLKALSLSGCNIDNEGLSYLDHLQLVTLDLWQTRATAGGIKAIENCKSLIQLRISEMNLSSDDLHAIAGFSQLRELQLFNIRNLKDDDLKYLVGIKSLIKLVIEDCPIGDGGAPYLAQMKQLRGLGLSVTKITDLTLSRIEGLQNLTELWLEMTQIDDLGMKYVARLKRLQSVDITGTLVGDQGVMYLMALPALSHVDALGCYKISRRSIRKFLNSKPDGTVFHSRD